MSEDTSHDGSVASDTNDGMVVRHLSGRPEEDIDISSEGSTEEYDSIPAAITSDLPSGDSQQSDNFGSCHTKLTAAKLVAKGQGVKRKRGRPPGTKTKVNPSPKRGRHDLDDDSAHRRSSRVNAQAKDRLGKTPVRGAGSPRKSKGKKGLRVGKAPSTTQETEWEVERIVDARCDTVTSEVLYLVKWKDYSAEHNTWEPIENLANCKRAIKAFDTKQEALAKRPRRR
ncbi:uncharacterized protein DNG_04821 [Cephalotrichum gorgonifer]|uniref:Chromo domain-containing protein n=1 Tax=Cephalotrichum gorgonifer TaxID=2041049 RepID=A0AAE8MY41_9PEZI|nr:uncharacterized protein DNG_04821 [Cephalotrichum gorgonifer]